MSSSVSTNLGQIRRVHNSSDYYTWMISTLLFVIAPTVIGFVRISIEIGQITMSSLGMNSAIGAAVVAYSCGLIGVGVLIHHARSRYVPQTRWTGRAVLTASRLVLALVYIASLCMVGGAIYDIIGSVLNAAIVPAEPAYHLDAILKLAGLGCVLALAWVAARIRTTLPLIYGQLQIGLGLVALVWGPTAFDAIAYEYDASASTQLGVLITQTAAGLFFIGHGLVDADRGAGRLYAWLNHAAPSLSRRPIRVPS